MDAREPLPPADAEASAPALIVNAEPMAGGNRSDSQPGLGGSAGDSSGNSAGFWARWLITESRIIQ